MYKYFSVFCIFLFLIIIVSAIYKRHNKTGDTFLTFIEKHYKILLFVIIVIFLFTRLYELAFIPSSLQIDEAALAYNAFNIANYGVDRYTNLYPIYFLNFYSGQSLMYPYLAAILIKIFGYSLFVVRIPAVFFGLLTLVFGFLIGKELKGNGFGVLLAFIITICPVFIMTSRWALDCYLMLGLFTVSIYVLLRAIRSGKIWLFVLSGVMFGLTLYTYALSYLIVPVILLGVLIYLIYLKKVTFKQFMAVALPLLIIALPLILNVLVQCGIIGEFQTRFFTIKRMDRDGVGEISLSNVWTNLTNIGNYFINEPINNTRNIYGTLYIFSIPLVILGFVLFAYNTFKCIKERIFSTEAYLFVVFICYFLTLLFVLYSTTILWRSNAIFLCYAIFLAYGLYFAGSHLKDVLKIVLLVYLISFISFMYYYFNIFNSKENPSKEVHYVRALEDADKKEKEIYSINLDVLQWTNVWAGLGLKTKPWFYKEYAECFDKICFFVPNENYEDKIYIVLEERATRLLDDGFTCKKYGTIYECYKE